MILGLIIGAVAGFVAGILVGRANKKTVNTVVKAVDTEVNKVTGSSPAATTSTTSTPAK